MEAENHPAAGGAGELRWRGENELTFTSAFTSVLIACRPLRNTSTSPRSFTSVVERGSFATHLLVDLAENGEVGRGVDFGVEAQRGVAFLAGTAVGAAFLVDGAVEDWGRGEGWGYL